MAKRIYCPKCGIIKYYYVKKTLRVREYYDENGDYKDMESVSEQYSGALKKCPMCNRTITIEDW